MDLAVPNVSVSCSFVPGISLKPENLFIRCPGIVATKPDRITKNIELSLAWAGIMAIHLKVSNRS